MPRPTIAALLPLALLALGCEGRLIDNPFPNPPSPPPVSPPSLIFRVGDLSADLVVDAVADPGGDLIVAGTFNGSVDFDPGAPINALTSLGSTDIFVARYTATGTLVWVSRLGGTEAERVSSLSRDAAGNLYLGGAFQGSTDFDPGAGGQIITSLGGEDGFVAKLSPLGAFLWVRTFGGVNADQVTGVAADPSGRVYATGVFSGSAGFLPAAGPTLISNGIAQDGFVLGIDVAGAIAFAFPIGGPETDAANAITVTSGGTVVVGGAFRGSAAFAGGSTTTQLTTQGGGDGFLAAYSTAGALQWARALSGLGDEEVRLGGLAPDLSNGVVVTGTFTGTADFDPGAGVAGRTSLGATDWFAARFDGQGIFLSGFSVGSIAADPAPRPAVDPDGTLLLTGGFSGAIDFDPGSATAITASLGSGGATDAFAAKYTFGGGLVWLSRFGEGTSVTERQNRGNVILPNPAGGVVVAGQFFGSPDFDPGTSTFRLTSLGNADAFLVLLTSSGGLSLIP
jgi:hypothetical protein